MDRNNNNRKNDVEERYSIFFADQCKVIKTRIMETIYDRNEALLYIPLAPAEGPGVETIAWRKQTAVGQAKIITDYSTDIPSVDIYGEEESAKVYQAAIIHGWNKREVEKAAREGIPLRDDRAKAAKNAIENRVDDIAWRGNAKLGIPGFLNHPNVPVHVLADGAKGTKKWETKTPVEIGNDIIDMVNSILEVTSNKERPNTCLLPPSLHRLLATHFVDPNMTQTVLDYVKKTNEFITTWAPVQALETAGEEGSQRIVIYDKNPDKLEFHLPVPYDQMEPERHGLRWEVIHMADIGCTTIYYPQSVVYADNKEA